MSGAQAASQAERGFGDAADLACLRKLISNCVALRVERKVLSVHLSVLGEEVERPDCLSEALAVLDALPGTEVPSRFRLPGGDCVLVWRKLGEEQLRFLADALKDRLCPFAGGDGEELVRLFRLPFDAQRLSRLLAGMPKTLPSPAEPPAATAPEPLDFPALAELERGLAAADIERFVRRRPVYRQVAGERPLRLWERYQVGVAEVVAALAPSSGAADDWLTRRLTRTLDRRLLAMLAAPGQRQSGTAFGLRLNVESLLSPEFLRFDAMLSPRKREQVIIEIDAWCVMAEMALFPFAQAFVRSRGYLLALGGLSAHSLNQFSLRTGGFDLAIVSWSVELAQSSAAGILADPDHLVLIGADNRAALAWGEEHGIVLFQGRAMEGEVSQAS